MRGPRGTFRASATALLAAGLLAQLSCVTAFAQESATAATGSCESCGFGRTVLADTRHVVTAPVRWNRPEWRSAALKAIVVAGSMAALDKPVRTYLQDHRSTTTDRIADAFEPFGAEYPAAVLGGLALAGALTHSPFARNSARDGLISAIVTSGLIVPALKGLTGRSRPRTDQGPHDFSPLSGSASFPSGHAGAAFTIAASIALNNDRYWVKGLSYGVAGLVAYSRMEKDAHWLSDVTASAFIGIGVARQVHELDRERHGITFAPISGHDMSGIEIAMRF